MTQKRAPRIGPLDTAIRCRMELGRQYRRAVNEEITSKELLAFTHALKTIADMIFLGELEARLTMIETTTPPPKTINLRRVG